MAAAVFAPPLRLPLTVVQEGLEGDDNTSSHISSRDPTASAPAKPPPSPSPTPAPHYWRPDSFAARHGYLQSLALGDDNRWDPRGGAAIYSSPFGVTLPRNTASTKERLRRGPTRSLSESYIPRHVKLMAVAVAPPVEEPDTDTAPSSPPELSYSKSSKSSNSSVRSDTSDDEDLTGKSPNFEDIAIEDGGRDSIEDSNLRPESRPTLKRPLPRSMVTSDGTRRISSPSAAFPPPARCPGLRGGDPAANMPNALGLRRVITSPSAPSLFSLGGMRSSRSPSPSKPFVQNGVCVSPQTLASATPNELRCPNTAGSGIFSRRKSWQQGQQRKTAKEIEAEYNDEDEEVPADAILENVPISPMPGQPRLSGSSNPLSRSQSRSATPSPQRRPSYTNLHSANVPKGAKRPSAPTVLPNGQFGITRSPRNSRPSTLQHAMTMSALPSSAMHRKQRSKSWTDDLNDEARELSAALEEYADRLSSEKIGSGTNSLSNSPPHPGFLKQRAKSVTIDLPQIQKGNIMIDPLPISKEKEAVLTRTRPSWLPPKDRKEEKRHLKEWEQMMARAAENEKRRAVKEREAQETQVEMKGSIARIWDQHVLPNWELVVKEPRTRELWWRGVTPRSRGIVWQRAVGNDLELSDSSFDAALRRANELEEKIAEMSAEERAASKEAAWLDAIERDVRTALQSSIPVTDRDKRAPFELALADVLKASAVYRADVGYVYGTHLIAGLLCLHQKPSIAFVTLANLLNRPLPLAFHVHDPAAMARAYDLVLGTLNYKSPKLHAHLTSAALDLPPAEYLDPIFRCLFAYHLPLEHVCRIWDIFVFEGDKALVRAAVAVLGRLESRLYGTRDEVLNVLGWRNESGWEVGSEEEFVAAVREAGKVDGKGVVRGS